MSALPTPPEAPSRLEVLLTAFIFPGAGQIIQARYIVGAVHILLGLILVGALFSVALIPLLRNFSVLLNPDEVMNAPLYAPSIPAILVTATALLVLHISSIVDAAIAFRRRRALWNQVQRTRAEADATDPRTPPGAGDRNPA